MNENKVATATDVETKPPAKATLDLLSTVARLNEAGFTTAATTLPERAKQAARLAVAYEHYRFVREDKVQKLRDRFEKSRIWKCGQIHSHSRAGCPSEVDALVFMSLGTYPAVPPAHVIDAVIEAKGRNIFDTFEIATTEKKLDPDPIVFGRIAGVADRFFIAEWGHDVSISDFLEKNEG